MSDMGLNRPRKLKGSGALGPVRDAIAQLSGWAALFVAAVFGAVGNLAFAPFHLVPALAASLIGLVWMIDGARRSKRWGRVVFLRTLAFGFGHFLAGTHWIANAFGHVEGALAFVWLPIIVLPLLLASVWAAAMTMAAAFWSSSPSRVFIFALFFGLAEWVRGTLFGGFPWNLAATAWTPGLPMSQAASLGGVYWLTALTLLVLASPAALSDDREKGGLAGRAFPALLAAVLVAGAWSWGAQRLQTQTSFTDRHVVLMDAGIPMSQRFETYADEQLGRYLILSVGIAQPGDIVVWPEAPINVIWRNSGGTARGIIEMPDALDAIANTLSRQILITGSPQFTTGSSQFNTGETGKYYNTLAVFNGEIANYGFSAVYYKHRLVPLGELAAVDIVPFGRRISAILPKALQQMAEGGYSPGSGPGIITMQSLPSFVPLVCYEVLFPQVSRAHALEAAWLVNISLDGWFGSGIGPQQHYAQARFRAIETGLPLARAASRGVTAMVDPFGRETARGAVQAGDPKGWRSSVVRTPMPVKLDPTPYLRFGSAFFWMTLVMLAGLAVITWRR